MTSLPSESMGMKSFFVRVSEFQTFSFAGTDDLGSFHSGWVRAGVAMVGIENDRTSRECSSAGNAIEGSLWCDKERNRISSKRWFRNDFVKERRGTNTRGRIYGEVEAKEGIEG